MKLFLIALFSFTSLFACAQSGTGNLDASKSSIIGGDGTGKIVSATWAPQGNLPGPATIANANAIVTTVTVSVPGSYTFQVTLKDNLGNVATTTVTLQAYLQQGIKADASASSTTIILK